MSRGKENITFLIFVTTLFLIFVTTLFLIFVTTLFLIFVTTLFSIFVTTLFLIFVTTLFLRSEGRGLKQGKEVSSALVIVNRVHYPEITQISERPI